MQPPVESSPHHRGRAVGQRVGADDVDRRAHHRLPVAPDGSQQGLQPHDVHLAVAVQEHQDFSWGGRHRGPESRAALKLGVATSSRAGA